MCLLRHTSKFTLAVCVCERRGRLQDVSELQVNRHCLSVSGDSSVRISRGKGCRGLRGHKDDKPGLVATMICTDVSQCLLLVCCVCVFNVKLQWRVLFCGFLWLILCHTLIMTSYSKEWMGIILHAFKYYFISSIKDQCNLWRCQTTVLNKCSYFIHYAIHLPTNILFIRLCLLLFGTCD